MPHPDRHPMRSAGRLLAFLAVVLLIGCDLTLERRPDPSGRANVPLAGESERPSAPPEIAFVPQSYPPDAEAPCDQTEAETGLALYRGSLRWITSIDPATVVFELCDPDVTFLTKVAAPALSINDAAWLESRLATADDGGTPAITRELNGTGPFRLDRWSGGTELILSRFDGYRATLAAPSAIVFRWDADAGRRLEALGSGAVDGIDGVDAAGVNVIEGNTELAAQTREGLNTMYLGFNNKFAPFDRVQVRRAIALGLDREALLAAAFTSGTTVASHLTPCAVPNGCAGTTWWEQDILAAKDLLATVGFADGFTTTIQYGVEPRDYLPNPEALAIELQGQLRDNLGITATLEVMPFADLVAQADAGTLDGIHLLGARGRFPDARMFLDPRVGSGASAEFGDPFADIAGAVRDGARAATDEARRTAYTVANDAIRRRVPLVPLVHVGSVAAVRADVAGFVVSPTDTERFATLTPGDRAQFAWMDALEPEGLYCPDETSPAAMRVCAQVFEGLYRYAPGSATPEPALAEACVANDELDTWTCTLRENVRFHDGARLDANDVVTSYAVQWDATHPLHRGRTGAFRAFLDRFGGFLNPSTP